MGNRLLGSVDLYPDRKITPKEVKVDELRHGQLVALLVEAFHRVRRLKKRSELTCAHRDAGPEPASDNAGAGSQESRATEMANEPLFYDI